MKKLFIITLLLAMVLGFSQVPRFQKFSIADTTSALYMPSEPKWEKLESEDKSIIYSSSVISGEAEYGIFAVKLGEDAVNTKNDPVKIMKSYLNYLNENVFKVTKKTDIGEGHTLKDQPAVKGILEYAETKDGLKYVVKSWTDGSMIALMYVSSLKDVNPNFLEIYFNGMRFGK
jgi:hypothetical protein